MATPLSAVRTNLSLSLLSCTKPPLSCLVRLGLGVCTLLSNGLMSTLSSCATCCLGLWQIDSTAVILSVLGMLKGPMQNLGFF